MSQNYFKTESERNLWIKLNAEVIQYYHNKMNNCNIKDLGSTDKENSFLWTSKNQLEYDEAVGKSLRFSFEELLTLSFSELVKLMKKRNKILAAENLSRLSIDLNDDKLDCGF